MTNLYESRTSSAGAAVSAARPTRRAAMSLDAVLVSVAFAGAGCTADVARSSAEAAQLVDAMAPAGFVAGPVAGTAPASNELTEGRARLGKRLFYDPVLSRTREVSCGSCHLQQNGFAEPRAVSTGIDGRTGDRNASTLTNLAWSDSFFWDGRSSTLEDQVGKPIVNPVEMDLPLREAVARLNALPDYVSEFNAAYGAGPSESTLKKALASFVRTLVSGSSRYDRFVAGEAKALSEAETRGERLFFSKKSSCFLCHPAGALSESGFFNNGTFVRGGDVGREAVTGRLSDRGKFKVPGLRNVAVSGPYMHDGFLETLEQVVEHYARGGRGDRSTTPQITPLSLSDAEKADLVAFLRALTDEPFLSDPRYAP